MNTQSLSCSWYEVVTSTLTEHEKYDYLVLIQWQSPYLLQ